MSRARPIWERGDDGLHDFAFSLSDRDITDLHEKRGIPLDVIRAIEIRMGNEVAMVRQVAVPTRAEAAAAMREIAGAARDLAFKLQNCNWMVRGRLELALPRANRAGDSGAPDLRPLIGCLRLLNAAATDVATEASNGKWPRRSTAELERRAAVIIGEEFERAGLDASTARKSRKGITLDVIIGVLGIHKKDPRNAWRAVKQEKR